MVRWWVVVLIALGIGGCGSSGGGGESINQSSDESMSGAYEVVDTVQVGEPDMVERVAVSDAGVWVTIDDGTVLRLDPDQGEVIDSIDVGDEALAIAATDDDVWVGGGDDNAALVRIDPATAEVTDTITLGGEDPHDIAIGGDGSVWVTGQGVVWRVDPGPGTVAARLEGGSPVGITASDDAIWFASNDDEDGTVSRVEPDDDAVTGTVAIGGDAVSVASTENAVWVTNPGGGSIARVDAETIDVTDTVAVGVDPTWIAAEGNALWVTGGDDGAVSLIDAARSELVRSFAVGSDPYGVAAFGGDVWVVNRGDGTVSHLSPRS